jgi:hypothetical protein
LETSNICLSGDHRDIFNQRSNDVPACFSSGEASGQGKNKVLIAWVGEEITGFVQMEHVSADQNPGVLKENEVFEECDSRSFQQLGIELVFMKVKNLKIHQPYEVFSTENLEIKRVKIRQLCIFQSLQKPGMKVMAFRKESVPFGIGSGRKADGLAADFLIDMVAEDHWLKNSAFFGFENDLMHDFRNGSRRGFKKIKFDKL